MLGDNMTITGIIVEYNPLHNGHLKHIEQARKLTNCDVLIAVMSGNFVQRGEPAIIDKYSRVKAALENEVDLVIELPFPFVNQNASVFAKNAIELLKLAKCDYVVFGSEINDIEVLKTYAQLNINVDNLKEMMSDGTSYPKAYSILSQSFSPNDILGVAYLKALQGSNIEPLIIKRDNEDYKLAVCSATRVRKLVKTKSEYTQYTPMTLTRNNVFISDLFPLIKTTLMTTDSNTLKQYGLFAEGIENNLKKQASQTYNYDDFIKQAVSRRYTRARINRTLMFMLAKVTQQELDQLPPLNELRILGFNELGQKHIRSLIDNDVKVVTKFKNLNKVYRTLELRSTAVYISTLNAFEQEKLWNKEFRGPIIYSNGKFKND